MIAPAGSFRVVEPADVDAAMAAHQDTPDSRYLGGGTDLLVNLRRALGTPSLLIDLRGITELEELACSPGGTRIGAGVTLARLGADPQLRARHAAICEAAPRAATVVGSSDPRALPRALAVMSTSTDHVLMGEEMYAAKAYLRAQLPHLAGLRAADVVRIVIAILIVIAFVVGLLSN